MTSQHQRAWCATLAKLTAPMAPETAAAAFVAMLPMLPSDNAAYNRDTLDRAARREQGDTAIPNYDKIARVLADWRREQLPVHQRFGRNDAPRIGYDEPRPPTEAEIAGVTAKIAALFAEMDAKRPDRGKLDVQPAYLTPEQLAHVRDRNPLVVAARLARDALASQNLAPPGL